MFAGCCWWRSLAVDGCSGASRGHARVVRRPDSRWAAPSNDLPLIRPDISPRCGHRLWPSAGEPSPGSSGTGSGRAGLGSGTSDRARSARCQSAAAAARWWAARPWCSVTSSVPDAASSRASWRHAREPRPPCGMHPRRRPASGQRQRGPRWHAAGPLPAARWRSLGLIGSLGSFSQLLKPREHAAAVLGPIRMAAGWRSGSRPAFARPARRRPARWRNSPPGPGANRDRHRLSPHPSAPRDKEHS
jgi:hypothetical protein